ncbi:DUF2281 domain-containing protein [Calothrix sp. NIES-3974]|uniref:DUF2281 domain-containing protein n=1 Tax=Calothrix sp. NIES-3974 TaxID=2005462 RepID=UPI000B5FB0AA|nr:DUF2281 domain-containing protein [Calothrix sp. NIES-3974]BAZ05143.1 hypothetical protein NIES3974_17890 [Calothrix sp. NIES-3974]
MTSQTVNITELLIGKLQSLSPEQQQTLLDFVEFLEHKNAQSQPIPTQPGQKRVLGLNRGEIWMSDDFNEPLPDEFWLGEE